MENATQSTETADENVPERADWTVGVLGYVLLLWAVIVCAAEFNFGDPAARAAALTGIGHLGPILTEVPRNFVLLLEVALFMFGALAPGVLVLRFVRVAWRDEAERLTFALGLGLIVLTIVTCILAFADLLIPPVLWAIVAVCCAGSIAETNRIYRAARKRAPVVRAWTTERMAGWAIAIGIAIVAYLALLGALGPEVQFDARYYHLGEAKRYSLHRGFFDLVGSAHIWAYGLPHYQEVVYTFLFSILGMLGAKLYSWFGGLLSVAAIVVFCRVHFRSTMMGLVAALIFITTPIVTWSMATANNDLALVPFGILGIHAFLRWLDDRQPGWLIILGAISGYSYGIKSFGAFTVLAFLVSIGVAVYRHRAKNDRDRTVATRSLIASLGIYLAAAFVCALPMFVHVYEMTGNPVFPFLSAIFVSSENGANRFGGYMSSYMWATFLRDANPIGILALPWRLTVDTGIFRDLIGPIYLIALPVWLVVGWMARKTSSALRWTFIFFVLWCVMVWFSGAIEARYALIPLALSAILIAFVLVEYKWRRFSGRLFRLVFAVIVGCGILLNNPLVVPFQQHALAGNVMGFASIPYDYLYGDEPENNVQLAFVPDLLWIDQHLGPKDKVYDGVNLILFNAYSDVDLLNGTLESSPAALGLWTLGSPDALAHLQAEGVTYVDIYSTDLPGLANAALWPHLREVFRAPSFDKPGYYNVVFKVR